MGELKAIDGQYKINRIFFTWIIQSENRKIAEMAWREDTQANAHLLRSSRELYEALALCLDLIDDMSRFAGVMSLEDYGAFNQAPIIARAALSAARGETGQQS